jgi:ATP-binding cassette subfamily B (MDR/TAP) protein 1
MDVSISSVRMYTMVHSSEDKQDASFRNLLEAFLVFTFTAFVLVEAFGLGPVIMRRRKSIAPVFRILDRGLTMPTDEEGFKPPFMAGRIEFRHVGFRFV